MSNLQPIIRHLFGKENLEEIPLETLEQFAGEHPLFGAGQYLLAKKYQQSGSDLFQKQIQRAALYFHDPLWLHYQLSSAEYRSNGDFNVSHISPALPESTAWEPSAVSHDLIEEVVTHQEDTPPATLDVPEAEAISEIVEEPAPVENPPVFEQRNEEVPFDNSLSLSSVAEEETITAAVSESFENREEPPITSTDTFGSGTAEPQPSESTSKDILPETPEPAHLTHPLFPRNGNENVEDRKVTFEPFHTVDYFASQGIKVSAEIKDDDRLGKQMKSFTEWLRTMRRLPEARVEAELEKINDREVERLAAHSLDENEVVTEAMAEVYIKQGRNREAVEVYRKLSLLNPAKSAYFAAKIDALNH